MATSITRFGITVSFGANYTVGEYANGDPYVVAPSGMIVTNITPTPTLTSPRMHGVMVDPVVNSNQQAFDDNVPDITYNASLNAASGGFPFTVAAGKSVLFSESYVERFAHNSNKQQVKTIMVVTVLAAAPAAGSFRPPYQAGSKTHEWNTSQINWNALPRLAPVSGVPTFAAAEAAFERPWIELYSTWISNRLHPDGNQAAYGKEVAKSTGYAAMMLMLDYSQAVKQTLLYRFLQYGIDVYGMARVEGAWWQADGGHNIGRKLPLMFAGLVFNHAGMKGSGAPFKFAEDQTTWRVEESDVGRQLSAGKTPYTEQHVGLYEWGVRHSYRPTEDNSAWGASYRSVNYSGLVGESLAARVISGMRGLWAWEPLFRYCDRVMTIEGASHVYNFQREGTGNSIPSFTRAMWNAYKDTVADGGGQTGGSNQVAAPEITPVNPVSLQGGEIALSTVTSGATIRYTLDGSTPTSSSPAYTSPIAYSATVHVKAIALKSGMDDSEIVTKTYYVAEFPSTFAWVSFPLPEPLSGSEIPASFSVTPGAEGLDTAIGFGALEASAYTQVAAMVVFGLDGLVKARNGGAAMAVNEFTYAAGVEYAVQFVINTTAKTYDVTVTAPGGEPVVIAAGYGFRTEQAGISEITHMSAVTQLANSSMITQIAVGGSTPPTGNVAEVVIAPAPGPYLGQVQVTLSTATSGAGIRYTDNGSDPTEGSTLYTGPVLVTSDKTIKARAFRSGWTSSPIARADYTIDHFEAGESFVNMPIGSWVNGVRALFSVTPSADEIDATIGLAPAFADFYDEISASILLAADGTIKARNGSAYAAETSVPYSAGVTYPFRIDINIADRVYDLFVTPPGEFEQVIASGYAFRNGHEAVEALSHLVGVVTTDNTIEVAVTGIASGPYGTPPQATRAFIKPAAIGRRRR